MTEIHTEAGSEIYAYFTAMTLRVIMATEIVVRDVKDSVLKRSIEPCFITKDNIKIMEHSK